MLDIVATRSDKKLVLHPLAISFSKSQSLKSNDREAELRVILCIAESERIAGVIVLIDGDAGMSTARLVQRVWGQT